MTSNKKEKTYLKTDPPLPGQNWVVLSFVSPEDMIIKRNLFLVNHFLVHEVNKTFKAQTIHVTKKINQQFETRYRALLNKLTQSVNENDKILYNHLKSIYDEIVINEEEVASECLHEYALDYNEIHDRFSIYQSENLTDLNQKFDNENDNQTSIRGLKVRGTFNTREEADERANFVNETVEPTISTFVAPVGFWLPWDPDPDTVKESHYQNQQLNNLMNKYQENVKERNKFFEERKQEMLEDSEKDQRALAKERLKKKLKERREARLGKK